MSLAAGARLGPYEVLGPLGAGGMGEVFRACDSRLGRTVALKLLPAQAAGDPERRARFEREARAVAALSHPHICTLFDVGQAEGRDFLVMEYLEGPTLAERLDEGPLAVEQAIRYGMQMADALERAHAEGIVHRDLKPSNVVLTRAGVKLVDFGLARLTEAPATDVVRTSTASVERALTERGLAMGTLPYMAPEQIEGEVADARTDIFALGVVLYEMATGRPAFSGKSRASVIAAILQGEPPPLAGVQPLAPPGLERVVKGCLAKDPEHRWQTAREVKLALGWLTDPSLSAFPAASRSAWRGRGRVAATAALVALALGGAWALGRSEQRPPSVTYHRLTFQPGNVLNARFAADGQTVVYAASVAGRPTEVVLARVDGTGARSLDLPSADILAISRGDEMAVLLKSDTLRTATARGVLARVPLTGGAPREVLPDVTRADWDPQGGDLAVVRSVSGVNRIEYPIGRVLYQTPYWIRSLRVSPTGDRLAFVENARDLLSSVKVVDRQGTVTAVAEGWYGLFRVAWKGDEVLFGGGPTAASTAIRASVPGGPPRVIVPGAGSEQIVHDVSRDGRLLVERAIERHGIRFHPRGAEGERDLSWLDDSFVQDISADRSAVLFTEKGEGGEPAGAVYVRRTDASPAKKLGDGSALALSPDGRWALSMTREAEPRLRLLPTGTGEAAVIGLGGVVPMGRAAFVGDGQRIALTGVEPGRAPRVWIVGVAGGTPRPLTPEGVAEGLAVSPDGTRVAANGPDGAGGIYSIDGEGRAGIPGLTAGELPIQWSADGRSLYLFRPGQEPAAVFRLDLATSHRQLWRQFKPNIGYLARVRGVVVSPDGASYAYTYETVLAADLFVVELR